MNPCRFHHQSGSWFVAALLISTPIASAATVTWDGDTSANWSDAGNWNAAPVNNDNLTFSGTGNQTNANDAGITSIGTLTLSNAGWDIDLGASPVVVNGIVATDSSSISGTANMTNASSRTITLNGTGSTLALEGLILGRVNNVTTLNVNGAGNLLSLGSLQLNNGGGGNNSRTINAVANVTVSGNVTQSGNMPSVTKTGSGTLTFNGTSTYTGATNVDDGTLLINGDSSAATGSVTVGSNGTLGGIGMIGGATTVNGSLAPGSTGAGKLNFEDALTLAGTVVMQVNGLGAGNFDLVALNGLGAAGLLTYGGAMTLDIGSVFSQGDSWDLFDFDGETGTFSSITLTGTVSGSLSDGNADGVWEYASGSDLWTFDESSGVLAITAIPEPRAALLGAFGTLLLLRRRR